MLAKERPARDILADLDIMEVQAQQVLTARNPAHQFTVGVVVVVQAKKEFLVGVGMQTQKAVTA
jgi:hypothetical protein